jgi:hypothetical protein
MSIYFKYKSAVAKLITLQKLNWRVKINFHYTDEVGRNCHFPVPGWNCMTHRQALQSFPDKNQVSLHKEIIQHTFF